MTLYTRILNCLNYPQGQARKALGSARIAAICEPDKPARAAMNCTTSALSVLRSRGLVEVAGKQGRNGLLNALTERGKAVADALPWDGDLSDVPVQIKTKAVDGQAPRGAITSVFSLAKHHGGVHV